MSIYATDENKKLYKISGGSGTKVTLNGLGQKEWSADFAENERQKSKNLLSVSNESSSSVLSVSEDGLITFNGGVGAWSYYIFKGEIHLKAGQPYTLSIQNYTGSGKNSLTFKAKKVSDGSEVSDFLYTYGAEKTITPTEDVILTQGGFYFASSGDVNFSCYVQIEEGTVATDYQPYTGAIVHEKDIVDVEHYETIYDMSSSDSNINKGFTSGLMFSSSPSYSIMSTTKKNKYKCFKVTAHLVNTDIIFYFKNTVDGYARGGFACQAGWLDATSFCFGQISIASWGTINGTGCRTQKESTTTDRRDNSGYYISKIEGMC